MGDWRGGQVARQYQPIYQTRICVDVIVSGSLAPVRRVAFTIPPCHPPVLCEPPPAITRRRTEFFVFFYPHSACARPRSHHTMQNALFATHPELITVFVGFPNRIFYTWMLVRNERPLLERGVDNSFMTPLFSRKIVVLESLPPSVHA